MALCGYMLHALGISRCIAGGLKTCSCASNQLKQQSITGPVQELLNHGSAVLQVPILGPDDQPATGAQRVRAVGQHPPKRGGERLPGGVVGGWP